MNLPPEGLQPPVLLLAGIWEPTGDDAPSCAILTVPARPPLDGIHDREPLALDPGCLRAWLDPALTDREGVRGAVRRLPASGLQAHPVSTEVNRPEHRSRGSVRSAAGSAGRRRLNRAVDRCRSGVATLDFRPMAAS
jgi:putative SOS response-associated peptidase YedK